MTSSSAFGYDELLAASSLSAANKEATREQRDLEALAIRMFHTAQVQKAMHEAAAAWLSRPVPVSVEALQSFDGGIADFAFHCVLEAANSDSNYPKVLRVECEPHRWFNMDVPGSRRGGNNADNSYRIIPVDGLGRFEIIGRLSSVPPADVTFTLIGNTSMSKTLALLEMRNVAIGADGIFVINVDPHPSDGRKNHLQSTPEAKYVFVRDSLTQWETQQVNALVARRLERPTETPLSFDQLLSRAVQFIADDTPYYKYVLDVQAATPLNTFSKPFNPGQFGGLLSQRGSFCNFKLADDEALIVTCTLQGANYLSLHAHDPWWRTIPFEQHTSTLNKAQALPNSDGTFTFVIAVRDPGVHNWIDTAGLHEGINLIRWQGLPDGTPHDGGPEIEFQQVVKLDQLRSILPPETCFVTSDARARQIAKRAAGVAKRWRDH